MQYQKINSLFMRDKENKKLITSNYSIIGFENVVKWRVDEKIDGTNIRIFFNDGKVSFGGRTKDAQIPCRLFDYLQKQFTDSLLRERFKNTDGSYPNVILFGEGYGPHIQACGDNYTREVSFILFDVFVNNWWLERDSMRNIADQLNIASVPDLGVMTKEEIINFVKSKPLSRCSINPQMMEGIVARSEPLMFLRNGQPLIFKLKCKDFT